MYHTGLHGPDELLALLLPGLQFVIQSMYLYALLRGLHAACDFSVSLAACAQDKFEQHWLRHMLRTRK